MTTKKAPAKAKPAKAPRVEKRKVTMKSAVILSDNTTGEITASDYVPVDILDDYVADARTRWQLVTVENPDKHDPGPAGDDGPTNRPKLK
jgi:hypothetical protein